MRQIDLDAGEWRSESELWNALLGALGAPTWHGRNLDALWDTITEQTVGAVGTPINAVQPPFAVQVRNAQALPEPLSALLHRIRVLFDEAREEEGTHISLDVLPPSVAHAVI